MVKYENECVNCPNEIGCIGDTCTYLKVPHYYCDECGTEIVGIKYGFYPDDCYCNDCFSKALIAEFNSLSIDEQVIAMESIVGEICTSSI